jgi:hypothetical protein
VFPCTFHYVSGSKKCANADKCKFSHEFTAPGLAKHNELHPGHQKNYDLLKDQQIMEPILKSIDCKDCKATHPVGKCKLKRRGLDFSGHVCPEDQAPGLHDVNRYAPLQSLQRTIENELAQHHD